MATSSARQRRAWNGPAILSYGFRPFFLLGAFWAGLSMVLWIGMLGGWISLPTAFGPVDWHAHAFLIGYLGAVVAGFLLTAVPNWTGHLPVVGWRLGLLVLLWAAGRGAVLISAHLPPLWVAVLDLAYLVALAGMLLREIVTGRNWRNLIVIALLLALILGGALFHWQAAQGQGAAQSAGLRVVLSAAVLLISVIGGRIVPSFTRNWLVQRGHPARPAPPMQRFDVIVLGLTLVALLIWIARPEAPLSGTALIAAGVAQALRLGRWAGYHTGAEPLVWVLHVAYAFVPLGALGLGGAILWPGVISPGVAQHLWMAGAIGLMTLAVMTRATLGHTGQALRAGRGTVAIYLALIAASVLRVFAGFALDWARMLYTGSGVLWCLAFFGFCMLYGPLLLRGKPARGD